MWKSGRGAVELATGDFGSSCDLGEWGIFGDALGSFRGSTTWSWLESLSNPCGCALKVRILSAARTAPEFNWFCVYVEKNVTQQRKPAAV